jgi:hypothetical protein
VRPDSIDSEDAQPIAATPRLLLISVDGLHQVDLTHWIAANPTSTLASRASTGVEYQAAHTTTPSDSFPGIMALATGGTPKSTGVYYDDSYDRTLYAPGSACTGQPGTEVIFDESIDYDSTRLFSGGVNAANLPYAKDASGNCNVVYPDDYVKVNTIFELVRSAGGYTAWSDKHPTYEILNGPSGVGVDDPYAPAQASNMVNAPAGTVNGVDLAGTLAMCNGTTNVFIQPNWGTIYSGSSKKIAEHGGGQHGRHRGRAARLATGVRWPKDRHHGGRDDAGCSDDRAGPRKRPHEATIGHSRGHVGAARPVLMEWRRRSAPRRHEATAASAHSELDSPASIAQREFAGYEQAPL